MDPDALPYYASIEASNEVLVWQEEVTKLGIAGFKLGLTEHVKLKTKTGRTIE